MAYVIAQPCIGVKDGACVLVCPVDAIHPRQDEARHAAVDQLMIDPNTCVDCDLCAAECPANAIFPEDDLPAEWRGFIAKNADHFK